MLIIRLPPRRQFPDKFQRQACLMRVHNSVHLELSGLKVGRGTRWAQTRGANAGVRR
jgi:hypothetical protein